MISPCIGTDLDGISYKPIEDVIAFFQKTFLEFSVQDIELAPKFRALNKGYNQSCISKLISKHFPLFSNIKYGYLLQIYFMTLIQQIIYFLLILTKKKFQSKAQKKDNNNNISYEKKIHIIRKLNQIESHQQI